MCKKNPSQSNFLIEVNEKMVLNQIKGENNHGIQMVSKPTRGTGAQGYCYGTKLRSIFSLGRYTTVFQAEVYAIKKFADANMDRIYKNRRIYILSDSQAAIIAFDKYQITSNCSGTAIFPSCNWSDITRFN
jgi:hypothetical protein